MAVTALLHHHLRCSFGCVAERECERDQVAHLPRTHPLPSTILVVLLWVRNALEYLFFYLMHDQIHTRTHPRLLLLSDTTPPIHATTTTITASVPSRCLCSSVRSVREKGKKSRFEKSTSFTTLRLEGLRALSERGAGGVEGGESQIVIL